MVSASTSVSAAFAGVIALGSGAINISGQAVLDLENHYSNVGAIMVWRVDDAGRLLELRGFASKRRVRTSVLRRVVDETWALWSIPSYVCSGDSGGGIFLDSTPTAKGAEVLAANVSDGGPDCRRHNNNNRLDTRSIQDWIADTLRRRPGGL